MTCSIENARLCSDCNLVTVDEECDLCGAATVRHPEADEVDRDQYCVDCGEQITRDAAIVRTWRDDPYLQCEDGMLITVCGECQRRHIEEMTEDQEIPQQ
jgi:hypothetical protein